MHRSDWPALPQEGLTHTVLLWRTQNVLAAEMKRGGGGGKEKKKKVDSTFFLKKRIHIVDNVGVVAAEIKHVHTQTLKRNKNKTEMIKCHQELNVDC